MKPIWSPGRVAASMDSVQEYTVRGARTLGAKAVNIKGKVGRRQNINSQVQQDGKDEQGCVGAVGRRVYQVLGVRGQGSEVGGKGRNRKGSQEAGRWSARRCAHTPVAGSPAEGTAAAEPLLGRPLVLVSRDFSYGSRKDPGLGVLWGDDGEREYEQQRCQTLGVHGQAGGTRGGGAGSREGTWVQSALSPQPCRALARDPRSPESQALVSFVHLLPDFLKAAFPPAAKFRSLECSFLAQLMLRREKEAFVLSPPSRGGLGTREDLQELMAGVMMNGLGKRGARTPGHTPGYQ
ncbi:hypothetical protein TREES_T100009735 [Tupaia chinensis]|uniref:Uncharacterized protein n=1 Tax=Tupaia chinensis TaxID=246437 RepID=L9KZ61_TUPCH|nr:hypothetical protein TREES_T100009735 [Tupaia chinensis]